MRDALSGARIVTLTDAPGIGKTSLARAITAHHRDRCVLVELASLTDSRLVAAALVAALGVHEASGQPALDAVVAQRAGRRMLLVLDNCEHLLETCADTAAQLVARCPELHVLATSREPLDLPAERVVHVPPLAVPAATEDGDVETLLGYPSVRLFAQRASRAQPRFALTPYVAGDVAEICRRLDGLPLAIELARPHLAARRPLRRRPPRPTTCFAAARGSPQRRARAALEEPAVPERARSRPAHARRQVLPQRAHLPPQLPRPALDLHRLRDVRVRPLHDGRAPRELAKPGLSAAGRRSGPGLRAPAPRLDIGSITRSAMTR